MKTETWTAAQYREFLRTGEFPGVQRAGERPRASGPNATEARFAGVLQTYVASGVASELLYESLKIRLGKRCWYTPDFLLVPAKGSSLRPTFYEVKGGFIREDAIVKAKAAAEIVKGWADFVLAQYKDGEWRYTDLQEGKGGIDCVPNIT